MARRGMWAWLVACWLVGGEAAAREPDPAASGSAGGDESVAESLAIAARIAGAPTGHSPSDARELAASIVREARAVDLDPLLVAAVIEVESSFRPEAISRAGALGLMQVMPATGAWLAARFGRPDHATDRHLLDPEWNVALGVRYLALLVRWFGRVDEALVAYNAGPNRARELLAGEERERWLAGYPRKVLERRDSLRSDALAGRPRPAPFRSSPAAERYRSAPAR